MSFEHPSRVLRRALPELHAVLPKSRPDLDEAVAFLDAFPLRRDYLAATTADDDARGDILLVYSGMGSTLEAYAKKTKLAPVKAIAEWLRTFTRHLISGARHCRAQWLRDPASDADLARLGDALPYPLPLEVFALLTLTNGFAADIYPIRGSDLPLADVDTMLREYADLRQRSGADNYLPVFTANGNHLLVKLDDAEEKRKASPAMGVKGRRSIGRGALLHFNHEEGLAAAVVSGAIDHFGAAILPREGL